MKCEIITIGTEILLGEILNSNVQYLSQRLAELGIFVYYHTTVGDNPARVLDAFTEAFKRCELVICTGGLGPTKDDLSKEQAAVFFNKKMILDKDSAEKIKLIFQKRNWIFAESNMKQAYFPENSIILQNDCGTAPGFILEEGGKTIAMLPGPPSEMKDMFEKKVVPFLSKYSNIRIFKKIYKLIGIGEGLMAEKISDLLDYTNPTVAPYAKENEVTIRVAATAESLEKAQEIIAPVEKIIYQKLGEYIYGEDDQTLEEKVAELLIKKNLTIAIAESCTGGLLSAKLVNYSGISKVLLESAVTYSNDSKINRLNVSKSTLEKYGAVSCETAAEMAKGIAVTSGADIGTTVTGIAGPSGGSEEKPVGLVCFGFYIRGNVFTYKEIFGGDRMKIRNRAAVYALNKLTKLIAQI